MGVKSKESHRLLDYQLSDFLEIKLGKKEKHSIPKIKQSILKYSGLKGSSLSEFPAIGTSTTCIILPNGFSKKLKNLCLVDSDGRFRKIRLI